MSSTTVHKKRLYNFYSAIKTYFYSTIKAYVWYSEKGREKIKKLDEEFKKIIIIIILGLLIEKNFEKKESCKYMLLIFFLKFL